MEIRDLSPLGYEGYAIREDGVLINPNGRLIYGNQHGQVTLPKPGGGKCWRSLSKLKAIAFVDPLRPPEFELESLDFMGYPGYYAREDGYVVQEEFDGLYKVLKPNNGSVRMITPEGQVKWERQHYIIATCFVPNPTLRKYVVFKNSINRNDAHPTNLMWSRYGRGHTIEDRIVDMWVNGKLQGSIEDVFGKIAEALELHPMYIRTVLQSEKLL